MKSAKIFWQSQSGNTYTCVLKAKEALEGAGCSVSLSHILSGAPDAGGADLLVFAFPVYNFKPATAMAEFIEKLPACSKETPALALITCTGLMANIPYLLRKKLKPKNILLAEAVKIPASETYILLRKYFKGTMELDSRLNDTELEGVKSQIAGILNSGLKKKAYIFNPFSLWHWLGRMSPEAAPGKPFKKRSWDEEKCTLCGDCYALCPSGSITRSGDKLSVNTSTCVGCCGCFNICPSSAWKMDNFGEEYFLKNRHAAELVRAIKSSTKH